MQVSQNVVGNKNRTRSVSIIPIKTLSRKPYLLMLQDDSGEMRPVKLDPDLVNSNNALVVLDEYDDTCWVWIGRDVSMPTRMHALRMAKSVQKSGYKIKSTTIGMSTSKVIELIEKDESDPEVASNISAFKALLNRVWRFEDEVLAFDEAQAAQYAAEAPPIRKTAVSTPHVTEHPKPPRETAPATPRVTRTPQPTPAAVPTTRVTSTSTVEQKMAFLLYTTVKNAELVYTEKFIRNGMMGVKIEAPGIMTIEALMDGDRVVVSPSNFGDTEEAVRIRTEYEAWLKTV